MGEFRVLTVQVPHAIGGGYMAIVADEEAVGASTADPRRGVRIIVPPGLAQGDTVGAERLRSLLEDPRVTTILLYGSRSVQLAIDLGLASEDAVLEVNGLKHAIVYKFHVHGI